MDLNEQRFYILLYYYYLDLDLKRAKNFYGNVKIGTEMREISRDEVEDGLNAVEKIIEEAEAVLNGDANK